MIDNLTCAGRPPPGQVTRDVRAKEEQVRGKEAGHQESLRAFVQSEPEATERITALGQGVYHVAATVTPPPPASPVHSLA